MTQQLAEDNLTNVRVVQAILRRHVDAPVAVAGNGLEAVALVSESMRAGRAFDCILMDVQVRLSSLEFVLYVSVACRRW